MRSLDRYNPPAVGAAGRQISKNMKMDNFGKLTVLNPRSVRSIEKTTIINNFMCDDKINIFVLTETWLTSNDFNILSECRPEHFVYDHVARMGSRGGGIGILSHLKFCIISPLPTYQSFEYTCHKINLDNKSH
jgi:hypothetical protein